MSKNRYSKKGHVLVGKLEHVRDIFSSLKGSFLGIGMTAFSRILPVSFISPYTIVCLRKTLDIPMLEKQAGIFCLEAKLEDYIKEKDVNSAYLLSHPLTKRFIKELSDPKYILLYQNYGDIEEAAKENGWTLLANPSALRRELDTRAFFEKMISHLHLGRIPGGTYPIEALNTHDHSYWLEQIGSRWVIQLTEIRKGGGKGTFFINSPVQYEAVRKALQDHCWRCTQLKSISIKRFINGIPASMALCITSSGILMSGLQRQLIDLSYVSGLMEKGIFCGHVWDSNMWPHGVVTDVCNQARSIGDYLYDKGYRGILGIDFVIEDESQKVYPIEINPRFTGAFPVLSQLHLMNGLIPMEAFHMLEFMKYPYRVDIESMNRAYARAVRGSQILLYLTSKAEDGRLTPPSAGLYEFKESDDGVSFVKKSMDLHDIKTERQFLLVDGPPHMKDHLPDDMDSLCRLCRLIFSYPVLERDDSLHPYAKRAIEWAYNHMFSDMD